MMKYSINRICMMKTTHSGTVFLQTLFACLCGMFLFSAVCIDSLRAQPKNYDTNSVIITRALSKDLFDLNSVPYMTPLVETLNATSNARFYNQAYVPKKVSRMYFRVSVHGMVGSIRDDQKLYSPRLPTLEENIFGTLPRYFSNGVLRDTTGLAVAVVKRLFRKGIDSGHITIPEQAATIFGQREGGVTINTNALADILKNDPEFAPFRNIPGTENLQRQLDTAVRRLPGNLSLPPGQNLRTIYAFVPQVEIGSLWGTELMFRFIPPVQLDTSIGDFMFWGVGIKHSVSQYVENPFCDIAVQIGYQGTRLTNTVGATSSKLTSRATFLNANVHASKKLGNIVDVYTGFNFERTQISATYDYVLSQEVQITLGLLKADPPKGAIRDPQNGYPGDDVVQTSSIELSAVNYKWTIGLMKQIGPFAIFADYNISRFNIFSGGLEYRF